MLGILALAALLGGCGSGDEATTRDDVAAEAAPAGSGQASGSDRQEGNGAAADRDSEPPGKKKRKGEQNGSPGSDPGDVPDQQGSGAAHRERVKHKLEKSCPPEADEASCEAMVEEFLISKGKSKSSEVAAPEDCTRAMSKEECEATLKAQKASQGTYSVDVEECLDDPTPRCEEVLRPLFEQQQAAEQSAG